MKQRFSLKKALKVFVICISATGVAATFYPNFEKVRDLRTHLSRMKQKLLLEEKRNYLLKKEFNGLSDNPDYIEKAAREKLGWCRPTETIYHFQN